VALVLKVADAAASAMRQDGMQERAEFF